MIHAGPILLVWHIQLPLGWYVVPSHDTMQRVWGMLEPKEFERCFCAWVDAVCQKTEGEIISIDGKTIRRSGGRDQKPIHMVSAWANQLQMVLGQLATDEKSNEITAVPELLEMLDIKGCIITADAMSCQKIAKKQPKHPILSSKSRIRGYFSLLLYKKSSKLRT